MLKIYLCTVEYYLHNGDQIKYLSRDTSYVIRDESDAVTKVKEWSAYTEEAKQKYNYSCELRQTRKGTKAIYWTWDSAIYAKEWIAPNVKLVVKASYEESSCTAGHLLKLPATDVIAYLKQEGLNLTIPS